MNKFAVINPHFRRPDMDDIHEIARGCESNLLEAYNFGDMLKLVTNNWLDEDKAIVKLECGGNMYGHPAVFMTVTCTINEWMQDLEGDYFDMPVRRAIELRFCGDGIIDATMADENGEQFVCCFDDHNWRIDDKRHLLNDLIDRFVEAYKKENERKDKAIGY